MNLKTLIRSSLFVWLGLGVVACIYLFQFDGTQVKLRPDRVKFGIDLVGGTYITLEVDIDKAVEAELADRAESLKRILEKNSKSLPLSQSFEGNNARLTFETNDEAYGAQSLLVGQESTLQYSVDGPVLVLRFKDAYVKHVGQEALTGNVEVLRTRLDNLGVGEIPIAAQGDKFIIVELPNVNDPAKAKEMIGRTALLEIKLVERMASSPEEIIDAYDGQLPDGMIIVPGRIEGARFNQHYYLVPAFTDLTGRLLKDAHASFGGNSGSEAVVSFAFSPEGGEKFYELTRKGYNRQLAIILDNIVLTAPRVSEPIRGGQGNISGGFTPETAQELAMLLKSGAFVAPVKFAQERQIGPSLGQESIRQGLMSCGVGLLLLLAFSIIVYKTSGLFAFLALLYNLLLILLVLGWLRATLTLPGIAGMVLTVGMAIDASILIYEKIREELHRGIALRKAVNDGFSDAMEVILDSNITTLIVGIVLYKFGTGPIQGFALTMMIGIIATLITGLFFLRSIFNFLLYTVNVQKIKI